MKSFKNLTLSAAALAVAYSASADPLIIRIAGSNADRIITNTAISHLLTGASFNGNNSDFTKANFGVFYGGTFGPSNIPVTVKVSFIGATGAIAAIAGTLPVNFLPTNSTGAPTSTADPTVSGNPTDATAPDFGVSSNFQATSPFQGSYLGHFYEDLTDDLVSILPFKWLGSKNFPGTNITTNSAQLLYSSGKAPLALFTGNNADETKVVFAIGRNTDAGARYASLAEIGLGVTATVKHYQPKINGAAAGVGGFTVGGTVTSHALWPIETFSGISSQFAGNGGFPTGAAEAPVFTAVLNSSVYTFSGTKPSFTAGYYVGYLAQSDADQIAIPNGAVQLSWNGVAYSTTAIAEGQYTYWAYGHVLKRNSLAGTPLDFHDALVVQVTNTDASVGGLKLTDVHVLRAGEGGIVSADYF